MKFFTAINCMDGRVQLPVIEYLKKRFCVEYVDTITEPGPNLILAEQKDIETIKSIKKRLEISVEKHHSMGIAVVGHHDCAGNPAPKSTQLEQLKLAVQLLRRQHKNIDIIGLWVDENWNVEPIV
jgi:hypothetical protein